jgi:hypothetical protein
MQFDAIRCNFTFWKVKNMPFDNVHGFPTSRPSGVAAAVAVAADVARVAETPEPRQVDQSCCAERQEADVGEGWRELGPDDILRDGDEVIIEDTWLATASIGRQVGAISPNRYRRRVTPSNPVEIDGDKPDVGDGWRWLEIGEVVQIGDEFFNGMGWQVTAIGGAQLGPKNFPYRRRVTPDVPEEPQSRPAETRASSRQYSFKPTAMSNRLKERAALVDEKAMLKSEVTRLGNACEAYTSEIVRLRSEVERLSKRLKFLKEVQQLRAERLLTTGLEGETQRVSQLQRDWRQVVAERNADIERLTAEVERLRLTEEERKLFELLANMSFTPDHYRSTLLAMLKRHGGGE